MLSEKNTHNIALQKEAERERRKKETTEMRKKFDEIYKESVEKAKFEPLPKIVSAYKNVYGKLPKGWPHK